MSPQEKYLRDIDRTRVLIALGHLSGDLLRARDALRLIAARDAEGCPLKGGDLQVYVGSACGQIDEGVTAALQLAKII